ncbi:hypothetical protein JW721_03095 [Candidatus Micrarchaeota archaeon]|nr:hypothetical protein [Candidatus Micrarchaeota archaeon]
MLPILLPKHTEPKLSAMLIARARMEGKFLKKDPKVSPLSRNAPKKAVSVEMEGDLLPDYLTFARPALSVESPAFFCGEEEGLLFLRDHNNLQYFEREPHQSGSPLDGRAVSIMFGDTIEAYLFDAALSPRVYVPLLDAERPSESTRAEGGAVLPETISHIIEFVSRLPDDITLRGEGYFQGEKSLREQLLLALAPLLGGVAEEPTISRHGRTVRRAGAALLPEGKVELIEKRNPRKPSALLWKMELEAYQNLASIFGDDIIPKATRLSQDGQGLVHEDLKAGGKILIELDFDLGAFLCTMESCSNSDYLFSRFHEIDTYFGEHGVNFAAEMQRTIALVIDPKTKEGRLVFMDLDHASEPLSRLCGI